MKVRISRVVALTALVTCAGGAPAVASAKDESWDRVASAGHPGATFRLDRDGIEQRLEEAPREETMAAQERPARVSIPRPDGSLEEFEVTESPVMEPGLAARHPEIKTYAGRAVADAARTVRFDVGPLGLHASVQGGGVSYSVEPREPGGSEHVASHDDEAANAPDQSLEDAVQALESEPVTADGGADAQPGERVGLRIYRLALITDYTYAETVRDPAAPAGAGFRTTAAKVALVNRVNHILERDWAARLVLIDATDKLNLDTPALATSPGGVCGDLACYSAAQLSSCNSSLLTQNTVVASLLVGAANYDIGHIVMSRDTGGVAYLRSVGGAYKAGGCSANKTRSVTKYWLAMVFAHELGHQFGAHHTWSRCSGGPEVPKAGVEPGGGATIMSYAGVCPPWNQVQADREGYYSQHSLAEFHANATADRAPLSSVQDIRLNGFDEGDSYRLTFRGGVSAPLTPADHTAAAIKAAIEGIPGWPEGATVTPQYADSDAFVVEFGGSLAGVPVELLGIRDAVGVEAIAAERVAGGKQTNGGRVELTDNHHPVVSAPAEATIPMRTPFTLTGDGVDSDGDALTYLWEQTDGSETGAHDLDVVARTRGPLFSVFGFQTHLPAGSPRFPETDEWRLKGQPSTEPARSFPDVAQVLADNTNAATGGCPSLSTTLQKECLAELLPTASYVGNGADRTMGFRLTARDNHPGAGGTAYADARVRVDPGAGPFRVTSPAAATTVSPGSALPVTWSVSGTDKLADRVSIRLSLNGGKTFPITLAQETANDGEATVDVPENALTSRGVLKVEAVGGVWFDVARGLIITAADTTPPVAEPTFAEGSSNGWHRADVTVVWNWSDEGTGTGIDPAACPATSISSGEGAELKVTATCADVAGNRAEKTVDLKVDKTRPVIALASRPPANANGWHNTDVTITWSCADDLSGVVSAEGSVTLRSEGSGQSATGVCTDKAGNTAWDAQTGLNIDKTAPTIRIASPADGATFEFGQPVDASYACAEEEGASGVATCTGDVASGGPVDTASVREHSFTVHATDAAGNAGTETARYAVAKARTRLDARPLILSLGFGSVNLTVGRVSARLTYGAADKPAVGRRVRFTAGSTPLCTATAGADGTATCTFGVTALVAAVLRSGYTASFAGDANLLPSSDDGSVQQSGLALPQSAG